MNKHWDYDVPSIELWKECLRVLKPGGHLLSFAGTRTYHRMTVRIEDAGFEIRDMISYIYGSGFPKSLDISKGIEGQNLNGSQNKKDFKKLKGEKSKVALGFNKTNAEQSFRPNDYNGVQTKTIDIPQSNEAIQWNGWGTALKPACEPICVARKPIEGTVANNVLQYGTGGINIDGCRVETNDNTVRPAIQRIRGEAIFPLGAGVQEQNPQGRFPANIIFDEIAGVMLDEMSGESISTGGTNKINNNNIYGRFQHSNYPYSYGDKGGASRFFYCAKASKAERNGGLEGFEEKEIEIHQPHNSKDLEQRYEMKSKNFHPTVKPLKLMQYLVRLVTPPNGVCLDPFCGSGTTLMACVKEGFNYIGIEREAEYVKIAEARVEWIKKQKKEIPEQTNLFKPAI